MSEAQKENVSHMLAAYHLVIRQADGKEESCGSFKHLTNTTYERFVNRYAHLIKPYYICSWLFMIS